MREHDATEIAAASGGRLLRGGPPRPEDSTGAPGPSSVAIDSREVASDALFVGIPGERVDGGRFAADVLAAGAWGVLCRSEHADAALVAGPGAVIAAQDPVRALGALARWWRRELRATVVAITGSVGKTSTKDLLAALLEPHRRTAATAGNLNTEIGLPLAVLAAPTDTEVLVLEMAMRGPGQIAELAAIAEPDVGLITNIAPVHLEILGSLEAIAEVKAELLHGLVPGGTALIPAGERLLDRHRPPGVEVVTFGPGGDVDGPFDGLRITGPAAVALRRNLPAAVAACRAVGVEPSGTIEPRVSALRGERLHLPGDVVVIVDCYNANPMSTLAALDDLGASTDGRRVAVLGDMLELGPDERRLHAEVGVHARDAGVELLVAVGSLSRHTGTGFAGAVHWCPDAESAADVVPGLLEPGDTVLLKASRAIGLERVAARLRDGGA